MKKNLLIVSLFAPLLAFSQARTLSPQATVNQNQAATANPNQLPSDAFKTFDSTVNSKPQAGISHSNAKRGLITYNFVKVGSTYYDLQTNASMGRRVLVHSDGTISVVWTTSTDAAYNNRGTGYNYYDGSSWLTVGNPTARIETARLGWPSIGINGTKEWVMGHDANTGGFIMSTNASVGSTSWTSGSNILGQSGRRPIWGRIANNGDIFHCISSYADSANPGEPRAPKINGVFAPMTYSRSLNGGSSWDIVHSLLPGYDDTRFTSGGGDEYAIDVRDSIVVIVNGSHLKDVMMWKSTNNGLTFTKIIIDSFKYAPYSSKKLMLDTPTVCDGSLDVVLDKNGNAHVFWALSRVLDDDTTDEQYSFFPATASLAYWNEITKSSKVIATGLDFDRNKDNTQNISRGNISALSGGLVPSDLKTAGISSVARLGNTSLLHMPSAGIDANGNIFVTFSYPVEEDLDANNINLRDIMLVHSTDGGETWGKPQDVTQMIGTEEEFSSMGKVVDGFVHILFQSDGIGGTNLQNNSTADNNHPTGVNDIMYAAIPVSKILDGSIQTLPGVGIDMFDANKELFVVSQNFPNPFSNTSEVLIWLTTSSEVSIEITNISGQVISTQSYGELGAGNQLLTINGNEFPTGVYFYTVKTPTHAVTKKMTIN